jgi:diacylglycerol kinase family enzyme
MNHAAEKSVLILANPFSGSGRNRRHVTNLAAALRARGTPAEIVWHADERDRRLADPDLVARHRCLVAAGGDGTVRDIVNDAPDVPLAVLPLGNENLVASYLGYSLNPRVMAEVILLGETVSLDLGRVGERSFCLSVTAGFDADVVARVGAWRNAGDAPRRVSRRSYVLPVLGALLRYGFPLLELEADGVRYTGVQAFVFNVPAYPLGLDLAPEGRPDDGLLDWVLFRRGGRVRYLCRMLLARRAGHVAKDDVAAGRAKRIRLTSASSVPVQVDGEPLGPTPREMTCRPSATRFLRLRQVP